MNLVIHDFEPGWDTYVERKGYILESEISFDEVDPSAYRAVLFPGGRAPEYLRNDPRVINIAREFFNSGKYVLLFVMACRYWLLPAWSISEGSFAMNM